MVRNIDMIDSAEASPRQLFHERVRKELAWTLNEVESLFLSPQEFEVAKALPVTRYRLERAHAWLQALAEGTERIPEEADEDDVRSFSIELLQIYNRLVDRSESSSPQQESLCSLEEQRVERRIVNALKTLAPLDTHSTALALECMDTPEAIRLRKQLLDSGADAKDIVRGLGYTYSDESIVFRQELLQKKASALSICTSLVRVDTEQSFTLRSALLTKGELKPVFHSLTEVYVPEALEIRERYMGNIKNLGPILVSLVYDTSLRAMRLRQRALAMYLQNPSELTEPCLASLAASVTGVGTPQSMRFREQLHDLGIRSSRLVTSLEDVDTPESMSMRWEFLRSGGDPTVVLLSLHRIGTPESMDIRRSLVDDRSQTLQKIAESLISVATPSSMEFRHHLLKLGYAHYVMVSLEGVDTPEAMKLRIKLYREHHVSSVTLLESLIGIGNPEAMNLRKECQQNVVDNHTLARSLIGVYTPESFDLRNQWFADRPSRYLDSLWHKNIKNYPQLVRRGIAYAAVAGV